jgi:hypothetical protein
LAETGDALLDHPSSEVGVDQAFVRKPSRFEENRIADCGLSCETARTACFCRRQSSSIART